MDIPDTPLRGKRKYVDSGSSTGRWTVSSSASGASLLPPEILHPQNTEGYDTDDTDSEEEEHRPMTIQEYKAHFRSGGSASEINDWEMRWGDADVHERPDVKYEKPDEKKIEEHKQKVQAYVHSRIKEEELALIPTIEELPKFTPEMIAENRDAEKAAQGILDIAKTIVFFGKRGTGKTFAMRWILQNDVIRSLLPRLIVMTDTKINGFWQQYIPEDYVHEGFDHDLLLEIMERQKEVIKKWRALDEKDKPFYNPNLCVVFDDIISNRTVKFNETFEKFFTLGRHLMITIMVTSQYAKGVNTVARGNIDYAFIFKQDMRIQMESLADDFFNFFGNRHTAFEIIERFTSKDRTGDEHIAMAIALFKNTGNLFELISIMKAEDDNGELLGDEIYQMQAK